MLWENTLVIAAHPDDDAYGCGALIAALTSHMGKTVRVLYVSDGVSSRDDVSDEDRERREAEMRSANEVLGV